MNDTVKELASIMYGVNFVASFGYDVLPGCTTLAEAQAAIKKLHPEAQPKRFSKLVELDEKDMWEEIDFALNHREEKHGIGPELDTPKAEEHLQKLSNDYRAYVLTFLKKDTRIYSLPIDGLGARDVWWSYRIVLINTDGNTLFIHSSASD